MISKLIAVSITPKIKYIAEQGSTIAVVQRSFAGHEITEANRGECNEREIGTVDVRPVFPQREEQRTEQQIGE